MRLIPVGRILSLQSIVCGHFDQTTQPLKGTYLIMIDNLNWGFCIRV